MSQRWTPQWAAACVLLVTPMMLAPAGCGRVKEKIKESVDNNPEVRGSAVDSARKSCVQTAMAKAPKIPGIETRIDNYCDCFATKGLNKFSNSELASIGLRGGNFTPDQQVKLQEAATMCQSTLFDKPGPKPIPKPGSQPGAKETP